MANIDILGNRAGLPPTASRRATMSAPHSYPDDSIAEKIHRIGSGDRDAQAWLYDRFADRLYRRLQGRYGSSVRFDAEAILHDAYIWFFQSEAKVLKRFVERTPIDEQSEARLEGHLWGLACGVASNRRRGIKRSPESTAAVPESADHRDSEQQAIDRDVLFQLSQCLKKNGSRLFLYYTLRYVDGLTPDEISTVTGWERRATYKLKTSLNQGLARCIKLLGL